jgi:hypothetical protein
MTGIEIAAFLRPRMYLAGDGGRSKYPRVNFACYNNPTYILACENIGGAVQPPAIPRRHLSSTRLPLMASVVYPPLRAKHVVA